MAMARPILSSVHGEAQQILEAANAAEFVPAENPQEMASAILRLRNDSHRLSQLGQNGRRFVEEHYDRDRSAAALLAALTQLTAKIAGSQGA
jgi:glycosyltransferase involved in cell wall biosynthesis